MRRIIKALIFDLDGVLADTVHAHDEGWLLVAEHMGITLTPDVRASFRGRRRHDILSTIMGRTLSEDEIAALMRIKNMHYHAFLETMSAAQILPGVEVLLDAAAEYGLGLAVASSSYNARAVLDKTGLASRFDVVADGHTVSRAKPHADIFVWAAGALRVSPVDCAVFEDAEAGVIAAESAGMYVVGVGEPSIVGRAHDVVWNLVGFDLDTLLDR